MSKLFLLVAAAGLLLLLGSPAAAAARDTPGPEVGPSRTVVTFTFDGNDKSQVGFARLLARHDFAGTFYVNSGLLDYPGYLSVDQLRNIARNRNEVGGATLDGDDLSAMSTGRARRQVCDDRTTLAQLGFQVTSFAYPHGTATATAKSVAQACGYNSGRDLAGLYESPSSCSSCPAAETLPPTDDFRIRTTSLTPTLATLEAEVTRAEKRGGGWVPLVFTRLCVCPPGEQGTISPPAFAAFLDWLENRPPGTVVRTVDQVMGGNLKPVLGTPLSRLVPNPSPAISPPEPLSKRPAWTLLGLGIGQAQIIFTGVLVATAMVVSFRLASRGSRHAA